MSTTHIRGGLLAVLSACSVQVVAAQERPFLFSVATTTDRGRPGLHVEFDIGAGERAFRSGTTNQPEQRIALQASWRRLTMIGRVGMVDAGSAYQSSQAGEVLVSLLNPANARKSIALGGGVLHEGGGTNVLQARLVGGQERERWRLLGNMLLQKPLSGERDAVDLITTLGWARKFARGWSLGVEAVGEDLEGFWDPLEAEGGARILVGPSLHFAPVGRKWRLTAAGGPSFHPSDTGRSSDALRDLPPTTRRVGYAVKAGLTYRFY
jgi:hypothetical protein